MCGKLSQAACAVTLVRADEAFRQGRDGAVKFQRWVVRVHKWSALVVGLQVLLWIGGGFGMALMPIGEVRGEHRMAATVPLAAEPGTLTDLPAASGAAGFDTLDSARLVSHLSGPAWLLQSGDRTALVDARAGTLLSPLDAAGAQAVAQRDYAGPGTAGAAEWLEEAPWYYAGPVPVWRVAIDGDDGRMIFVAPDTGQVVSRRSDTWRLFDVFWRLHIMDYRDGRNINNPLLIGAAGFALLFTLSGLILLVLRLRRVVYAARQGAR